MGVNLNKIVKPQTIALYKKATIMSNEKSPTKRLYVEGQKLNFKKSDIIYLLKNIRKIYKIPYSIHKTVRLIKKDSKTKKQQLTRQNF